MVTPRVLGSRVLLAPLEANEQTSTGIVLPEESRLRETRGIVIAVGEVAPVAPGDVVVYAWEGSGPYSTPTWIELDSGEDGHGETLVVVDYADLLLVLDEEDAEVLEDLDAA